MDQWRNYHRERAAFLRQFRPIWAQEVLQQYPMSMAAYPDDWCQTLSGRHLDDHAQWQFDAHRTLPVSAGPSLVNFIESIKLLQQTPQLQACVPFSKVRLGLTPKKAHEIEQIIHWVAHSNPRPQQLIDIGGGVGHTSAIIAHELGVESICLECNQEFVELGERHRRQLPGRAPITHVHARVPDWQDILQAEVNALPIESHWPKGATSLGLHTCGPLALSHFAMNQRRSGSMLNIGCCYYRLDPERHTNLSQTEAIEWTPHALTLAARGHKGFPFSHFSMKKRVKNYRYALEFYLQRELGHQGFTAIGESKLKKYRTSFGEFAQEKLQQLLPDHIVSVERLNNFYHSTSLQEELDRMFSANLIRWCFGRVLEVHLIYDRVLYLEQQGMRVQWGSFFDESVSPRNIAIRGLLQE